MTKETIMLKETNKKQKRKVLLIIRDGWGHSAKRRGNALYMAKVPNHKRYMMHYPSTLLKAHGNAVGLPKGILGGSEVGHYTIGAGRVVQQEHNRISRAIRDRSFYKNKELLTAARYAKRNKSSLHLMGLLSNAGVHGTVEHLYALLKLAKKEKIKNVFVHCFLDGRDVPERSAAEFVNKLERRCKKLKTGRIASLVGRYYAMDRDSNYLRTKKAYGLMVYGSGFKEKNAARAISNAYARGDETDYYIRPIVIVDEKDKPVGRINHGDAVIFWNFRTDRARQIMQPFVDRKFKKFKAKRLKRLRFTCMTQYDQRFKLNVAFPEPAVKNNLGTVLAKYGLKQLRIAETEKYAHVTFFFNSQIEKPNKNEDRFLVPSPKIPNYAQKPDMSAFKLSKKAVGKIKEEKYDFILLNYANPDLVGHSGSLKATIKACETVDKCVGKVVEAGLNHGYAAIVTSDHGNCEEMLYPDGKRRPAHTSNPVQFSIISKCPELRCAKLKKNKGLANIAPTVLEIIGIKKPKVMAESLIND